MSERVKTGNNVSAPNTSSGPAIRSNIKCHENPLMDKGEICPICKDPACGFGVAKFR